jgi:arginine/lysine/ornithine decarboxylase
MKLTVAAKAFGYLGTELAELLRQKDIECEFADPDYLVLMLTPENTEEDLARLQAALLGIPRKAPIEVPPAMPGRGEQVLSIREAMLSPSEEVCVEEAVGRILASPSVGCPPAVPLLVCGQRITAADLPRFRYYGIDRLRVVKNA